MFKKLFVFFVLLAAFLIQVTGKQEGYYKYNRFEFYGDLVYGYPQPFLAIDVVEERDVSYFLQIPGIRVMQEGEKGKSRWIPLHPYLDDTYNITRDRIITIAKNKYKTNITKDEYGGYRYDRIRKEEVICRWVPPYADYEAIFRLYPELEPSEDREELDPRFGGKNAGKVPETPLSARWFAPVEWDFCGEYPTVCYKRRPVFLWEHSQLRPRMFGTHYHSYLPALSLYDIDCILGGKLGKFCEFNEHIPALLLTKTVTYDDKDFGIIQRSLYVPWRCILFDLAYIFAVFYYLRWIYHSNTRAWIFPSIAIVLLLLYSFHDMMHTPSNIVGYLDYCWLHQILYAINFVITLTLIYHATSWLLRSIFRRLRGICRGFYRYPQSGN